MNIDLSCASKAVAPNTNTDKSPNTTAMPTATILMISAHPNSPQAWQALTYAKQLQAQQRLAGVFFYAEGAYTANDFRWQSADVPDVAVAWASFANQHALVLPVCVSAALARGISDTSNAQRHKLAGDNLKVPFSLVGLTTLVCSLEQNRLMQIADSTTYPHHTPPNTKHSPAADKTRSIYIHLCSGNELICYESMALAFVLASFDYYVQLHITKAATAVLDSPDSRLHGMAKSLALYDMPPLWLDDLSMLSHKTLYPVCQPTPTAFKSLIAPYGSVLYF